MGYPKEVYDKAWEILSSRRRQTGEITLFRRAEIHRVIPEIREIEAHMARTAASVARAVTTDPVQTGERIDALRRQSLELQQQRQKLLVAAGYSADYLAEQHGCSDCRDTGYRGSHRCHCFSTLLKKEACSILGAVSQAGNCTFQNFSLDYYPQQAVDASGVAPRERMSQVLNVCRQYAHSFGPNSESLLMLGPTGLGKTHLSLSIASAATEAGYGVVYTPVQKLMDKLEAEKFSRNTQSKESYTDSVEWILNCDLLVLDDLGTEFYTQFTASVLYNLVNTRLVEGHPTIISTNLELNAIEEKYSQRMVSRLVCSYKVLKFYGRDIRFAKKSEGRG